MTFAPSRQTDLFATSDTSPPSSSAARPAKISPAPIPKAKGSTAPSRGFSSKPSASSEKAALAGSLLRTALLSEFAAMTGSRSLWRRTDTPAGRSWWVLMTSARTTNEKELGSSASTPDKMATPRATDGDRGGRGDVLTQMRGYQSRHAGTMISTPRASDAKAGGHGDTGRMGTVAFQLRRAKNLATPTASRASRASRSGKASAATMNARARPLNEQIEAARQGMALAKEPEWMPAAMAWAAMTESRGLTGTAALPVIYETMMGFPSRWLSAAFWSALEAGKLSLVPASLSRRSATRSSRKSRKPSAGPS